MLSCPKIDECKPYTIAVNALIGGLSLLALILIIVASNTAPYTMDYSPTDPTFMHTHKSERIPFAVPFVIAIGLILPFWIESHSHVARRTRMVWLITGWMLCALVINAVVEMTKKWTGRMRPDGSAAVSFPSGHSAVAMLPVFYSHYTIVDPLLRVVTMGLYFLSGWAIAMSRIVDNRHHEWDILGGIVVSGITVMCVMPIIMYMIDNLPKKRTEEPPAPISAPRQDVVLDITDPAAQ